jgi:hypothetical protein
MTTVIECRPPGAKNVASDIRTFDLNQHGASCRIRRGSIVLLERAQWPVPITRRVTEEITMIAIHRRSTLQFALRTAFSAAQLIIAEPSAPALFARGDVPFHPTVTAGPAPVGVGWG